MKALPKAIGISVLVLLGALASGAAMAQHRGYGHGYGHGHGGSVRFGISLGVPLFGYGYYPAPYYAYPAYPYAAPIYGYPPAVMGSSSPPVYIERSEAQAEAAPPQAPAEWYYCAAARAYYPYVAECPAGWQRVPAQPTAR